MKVIAYHRYGSADELKLVDMPTPIPADDQVLIKIHAVSINGSDREGLIGKPLYVRFGGLFRPGSAILGSDIAGHVEAVGKNHTEFKPGDEVFGEIPGYGGGFAEYVCTHAKTMTLKPASLTFEQAAAIPQAGVIAFNGILKQGKVQAGQKVLINGAGGSGGTFALQLAKLHGAEVTGVDNTNKLEFMRSLGADHVIDYTREDFTKNGKQYDLILDLIAHRSARAYQRALCPEGQYFLVGGSVATMLNVLLMGPSIKKRTGKKVNILMVPQNRTDLIVITELCTAGKVHPLIDRTYSLEQTAEAMRYVSEGHAKGKVVITIA